METQNKVEQNTVILSVELHKPGNKRSASTSQVKVDADKDMIHLAKDLLDSEEYRAICKFDGRLRVWIKTRCLPSYFREGLYLLPIELISEVDEKLKKLLDARQKLVKDFRKAYPGRIKEARDRLKSLFDPRDYPSEQAIEASFAVTTRYIAFQTPTKLSNVSAAIFKRELAKAEQYWKDTTEQIQVALRESLAGLVEHMVERCSGDRVITCSDCKGLGKIGEMCTACEGTKEMPTGREILSSDEEEAARGETYPEMAPCRMCKGEGAFFKGCEKCKGAGQITEVGKPKVFRETMIGNMQDFLDSFKARNITDDAALAALVKRAGKVVQGIDINELRKVDADGQKARDRVVRSMEPIKKALDAMLVNKPKRAINLEDEEVA